jgi:hypothetical protein
MACLAAKTTTQDLSYVSERVKKCNLSTVIS